MMPSSKEPSRESRAIANTDLSTATCNPGDSDRGFRACISTEPMSYTTLMVTRRFLTASACCFAIIILSACSTTRQTAQSYTENPSAEGNGDYTIGPPYKIDPDLTDRGNPKGKQF